MSDRIQTRGLPPGNQWQWAGWRPIGSPSTRTAATYTLTTTTTTTTTLLPQSLLMKTILHVYLQWSSHQCCVILISLLCYKRN